jgi:beta-lactam-binding protein with PASTA domain
VPDVVGARLADALRRLDAAGLDEIEPIDATGQDRVVLNPENWVVRAQQPAAGTRTGTGTTVTLRVAKPSDGAPSPRVVAGVVPDVVCLDLQTAQDTLQQAGFSDIGSADGTGAGRQQLVDRNWVVVRQSAAAGSRPGRSTRIVLTAVKYGEPTGASGCRS